MTQGAHVTSLEAIEAFRAALVVYLAKARPTLEEVSSDLLRTRVWLEQEQKPRWEKEVLRRTHELEQARQALFSAELSNLREVTDGERLAVRRARARVDEAQEKLARVKRWLRDFGNQIEPLARRLNPLESYLANDMAMASARLAMIMNTLSDYAEMKPGAGAAAMAAPDTVPSPGAETPAQPSGAGLSAALGTGDAP
jgi:DNA repair exonuclease SbcCD ATPase subunit